MRTWAGALDGSGRLVVVEGPAGIGKTSVLEAIAAEGAARGMPVLRGRFAKFRGRVTKTPGPPPVTEGPHRRHADGMTPSEPVRAILELQPTAGTIRGSVAIAGAPPAGFYGWLELIALRDSAVGERTIRAGKSA